MVSQILTENLLTSPKHPLLERVLAPQDEELVRKFYELNITHLDLTLEDVRFLMRSYLAQRISCYQNATKQGKIEHEIRLIDTAASIKCNGYWAPILEISGKLFYNEQRGRLVSHDNPDEEWYYISPRGLVAKNPQFSLKLEPIEKLSIEETTELQQQASKFFEKHAEIDPGKEKLGVLQVVTTEFAHKETTAGCLYSKTLLSNHHVSFRLIDEKGQLYSFGVRLNREDEQAMMQSYFYPLSLLQAGSATICSPDFSEFIKFHTKCITSIPITKERLQALITYIDEQNKLGVRFHVFNKTCASLAREVLVRAGTFLPELALPTTVLDWQSKQSSSKNLFFNGMLSML